MKLTFDEREDMKDYTICFRVTGGVTIRANSEAEALAWFRSEEGRKLAKREIEDDEFDVTYIVADENWDG